MTDEIAVRTDGSLFSTHTYVCTYLIALNNVLHTINTNTNLYPTLEDRILVAIVALVLECVCSTGILTAYLVLYIYVVRHWGAVVVYHDQLPTWNSSQVVCMAVVHQAAMWLVAATNCDRQCGGSVR